VRLSVIEVVAPSMATMIGMLRRKLNFVALDSRGQAVAAA
jgi:hypothetical protein